MFKFWMPASLKIRHFSTHIIIIISYGREEEVFWYNEGDLDEQLNAILKGALDKNKNAWGGLNPAQQAMIAEKIATKKEKLMEVLKAHNDVITSATIKDILQKAFE